MFGFLKIELISFLFFGLQTKNTFLPRSLNEGFSIIELIIVLMVSGIISTLVIPNYSKLQNYAKENNIKQTAYTVQMAIETYYMENGSYPTDTSIDTLLTSLNDLEMLKSYPNNAFTNTGFTDSDTSGLMTYSLNSDEDGYILETFGKNNDESLLVLEN